MAASKVLHTVELLEDILSFLPQRNVLIALRTCRSFKKIIDECPKLQKKLFLTPDTYDTGERRINYMLFQCHDGPGGDPLNQLLCETNHNGESVTLSLRAPWNKADLEIPATVSKMFLTQPPCKGVEFIFWASSYDVGGPEWYETGIRSDEALTMGDVFNCFNDQNMFGTRVKLSNVRIMLLEDEAWDAVAEDDGA